MSSADYSAARASFEQVVAHGDATSSQKFQAQRDLVLCEARLKDKDAAGAAWEKLERDYDGQLDMKTVSYLCKGLAEADATGTATRVVAFATAKFPEAKDQLDLLSESIAAVGSAEDTAALEALGYLGD
jgi:hypothetical protein